MDLSQIELITATDDAALEQCFAALRFRLPSDLAEEQEAEAEAAEWLEANIPSAWEVHQ